MTNKISRLALFICMVTFWMNVWTGAARAQIFTPEEGMLSRDIQVEQYVKGQKVDSWSWVNYSSYYTTLLQMAYDPVLPPARWQAVKELPDKLVVFERAQNGRLLRRFEVSDLSYVYTYATYTDRYFRDDQGIADEVSRILPRLQAFDDRGATAIPPVLISVIGDDVRIDPAYPTEMRMIPDGSAVLGPFLALLEQRLKNARPLDALEEMNLSQKFKEPGSIEIMIRPDIQARENGQNLPDSIVLQGGQILTRRSGLVTRGFLDRHDWRGAAMAQRKLYEAWRSRGITTPPKER